MAFSVIILILFEMSTRMAIKRIFGYFHQDPGSSNLAKTSIVGGAEWQPRPRSGAVEPGKLVLATTGQQVLVATERRVHGLLVASLVPQLAPDIDAIVLAEGGTRLITNFRNFLYCGR